MPRSNLPLRITTTSDGTPSVVLAGQELAMHLSRDGVEIRYVDGHGSSVPEVTLTFGPGALDLDFDVDLLEHLLAAKESNS